jgi:uncharacterized protein (DUF1800 family)
MRMPAPKGDLKAAIATTRFGLGARPGDHLKQSALFENRDLAPTLDMRSLFKGVLPTTLASTTLRWRRCSRTAPRRGR